MRNSFAFFRTCRPISRISGRYFSALNPRSSIHVLGTGNLGKFVAHSIAKHCPEAPVTLLFHRPGLVTAWEAGGRGIECLSDGVVDRRTNFNVELLPPASPDPTLTQSVTTSRSIKYLIVATKTYTTTAALSLVKNRLDSTSSVLFLQNGMGTSCLLLLTGLT
jgi:2-dehydropantoate 2-reductase